LNIRKAIQLTKMYGTTAAVSKDFIENLWECDLVQHGK